MAGFVEEEGGPYTVEQLQFLLGLALVLGFIIMLLIDQCGGGHSHNHSTTGEGRERDREDSRERERGREGERERDIHTLTRIHIVPRMVHAYMFSNSRISIHCKPRSLPTTLNV